MIFILIILLTSPCNTLEPKEVLNQTLQGMFIENSMQISADPILNCLSSESAQNIIDFVSSTMMKGANGGISDLLTLPDDLRTYFNTLSPSIIECIDQTDIFLELNYHYGIGYLPLAQTIFKNYSKNNFLDVHSFFGQVNLRWTKQAFFDAGYIFAHRGHDLFPLMKKELRAVWLTNVGSEALNSKENIKEAVQFCHRASINTIFVVVYNNARTMYPSQVMEDLIGIRQQEKFIGRDPLQEVIDVASTFGIQVHAWFEYGFSSSYSAQGGPIIAKKPSWKALDSQGNLVVKNGFDWLNGFDEEVQNFMISLFLEVINNYKIDGVQGDDRLPALPSTAGYDPKTVQMYKKENAGKQPPKDYRDDDWINWRVSKLNKFMKRLYLQVKQARPTIFLSVSPSPYPWSVAQYLQDWPTWNKYNWVDAIIPQCYRYNFQDYKKVVQSQVSYVVNPKTIFAAGILLNIGNYTANTTYLTDMVLFNRKLNISGESFFYYEGIPKQADWFQTWYSSHVNLQVM